MNLFRNYEKDFEEVHKEIEDVKSYIRGKNDKTLIALNEVAESLGRMEKQFDSLASELIKLQQLSMKVEPTGLTEEPVVIDEKPTYKKGGHITTYKHFDKYQQTREYDMKKGGFLSPNRQKFIKLDFKQLVAIIKGYRNGLSPKKLMENPILEPLDSYKIQNYIYIYRAGGFNQAIMKTARKLGYNPNKLISKEVKENV